jgi:hypothetical protein
MTEDIAPCTEIHESLSIPALQVRRSMQVEQTAVPNETFSASVSSGPKIGAIVGGCIGAMA